LSNFMVYYLHRTLFMNG